MSIILLVISAANKNFSIPPSQCCQFPEIPRFFLIHFNFLTVAALFHDFIEINFFPWYAPNKKIYNHKHFLFISSLR